ncbi:alpha/beta-hydrolase [Pholiota conissans]|uniref:Alpha/beta-hydrolase n=1 Tax=Pholiota conissans TaxID=109636 RepID=A0A9P5ZDV7_9AGAR|nr:alpha/beta-hydrolase [Pholiota conissans]
MIYDKNPQYPHYDHLPYAKEPWKSFYVFQRLFTTLALVPVWIVYYATIPRRYRPRSSWNLRQIVNVKFTRRIYKVTEVAGVTWGTRDPDVAPDENSLKETRFQWVEPLPMEYRTGILDSGIPFKKVGCYIWPKRPHLDVQKIRKPSPTHHLTSSSSLDLESGTTQIPLIGIFMHGGGYCHMSAHEKSRTSRIPRNLVKKHILQVVYSVEYRLLQHAPFPAVVQDAAAVYAHVLKEYGSKCKIILIGDSSGGNLVLSLARWIRDQGHLPLPHGLLLLSPSCDTSHALPETLSSHIPRPNKHTDYLVDTPEPRALLQRTFLGFKSERRLMEIVHSEYVSPCSPIVLKRWGHETKQDPSGQYEEDFIRNVFRRLPTDLRTTRDPENLAPLPAPAVAAVALTAATTASEVSLPVEALPDVYASARAFDNPYHKSCESPKLFGDFPRSLIICGDAERLVREVRSLVSAMKKDGVDLTVHWAPDACHDPLMLSEFWWDRKVTDEIWREAYEWARGFQTERFEDKRRKLKHSDDDNATTTKIESIDG